MRGRKFLAVGMCGMVAMAMTQGVSAAEGTSDNNVIVSYDYTGAVEPVSPNYGVKIPTGLVFNSANADRPLDVTVEMVAAPGEESILGTCQATVTVKSANGYQVTLANNKDAVQYTVEYENVTLKGTQASPIGTLSSSVEGTDDKLKIEGAALLKGVATKTGAHTDTLTYTITNVTV